MSTLQELLAEKEAAGGLEGREKAVLDGLRARGLAEAPGTAPAGSGGGVGAFVDNLARQIANGVTLNFADEFAGFMRSQTEGVPYDQAVGEERARDAAFEEENPVTSTVAQIGGAAVNPMNKLGMAGKGAGWLAQAMRGMVAGGVQGAVTGAGEAEGGLSDRAGAAMGGAVLGAAAGGVTPIVLNVAGTSIQKLGRAVLGKTGPKDEAARKVLKALTDDKITAQDAVRRLRDLGPEAGLVDVGEENVKGVARATTSIPGPARTVGKEFLEDRQFGQGDRVVKAAQSAFGEFRKFAATSDELMEARGAAAAPKYKEAYAVQVPLGDNLMDILQTDAGKRAFEQAKKIASNEGRKLPEVLQIADDGTASINAMVVPDMQAWDVIKRGFDSILNSHKNAVGKLDMGDPMVASVNNVRRRLIDALDEVNPAYKEARRIYSGPTESLNAMELGRGFLKGDVDLTAKVIKDMSPSERDFFRLGVIKGVTDVVENTRDITDVTGRLFGTQGVRDKMRAVFPDAATFKQFEQFMKAEADMAATRRVVLGNSATARIEAEKAELTRSDTVGAISELLMGNPAGAASTLGRAALNSGKGQLSPEVSERLGQILFTKDGKINEANLKKIYASEPIKGLPEDARREVVKRLVAAASARAGSAAGERKNKEAR